MFQHASSDTEASILLSGFFVLACRVVQDAQLIGQSMKSANYIHEESYLALRTENANKDAEDRIWLGENNATPFHSSHLGLIHTSNFISAHLAFWVWLVQLREAF